MNKDGVILFGGGTVGDAAYAHYGAGKVFCFADNFKAGGTLYGKNIISFDELAEIHTGYKVVVSTDFPFYGSISKQLDTAGIPHFFFLDEYRRYLFEEAAPNPLILKWKDAYKGEKCFLIGNGPSLSARDLDKIKDSGFISIGCNYINKMFGKCAWRPDFYIASDITVILPNMDFIKSYDCKAKFIAGNLNKYGELNMCPGLTLYNDFPVYSPEFSADVSKVVYGMCTVMYDMLQIAAYMGFSEIYLLGADNTQPILANVQNAGTGSHFYKEDVTELAIRETYQKAIFTDPAAYRDNCNTAYGTAKRYADGHGFKILNATRGGSLDVFERVDFDTLF
jgi:hypothetical protein